MEIRLPPLLPAQTGTKGLSSLTAQLRPGQYLTAVVETQLAQNNFLLKLAESGRSIRAHSQLDLTSGQVLKLEVINLGPIPELRIVPPAQTDAPEALAIQQALRQFLPRQTGLAELASTLQQALTQQAGKDAGGLPDSLRALIRTVLDALPQKKTLLTPEGLRRAARDCGVFFEARLAAQPSALQAISAGDLKSRLLALDASLRGLLPADNAGSLQTTATPMSEDGVMLGTSGQTTGAEGNRANAGEAAAPDNRDSPEIDTFLQRETMPRNLRLQTASMPSAKSSDAPATDSPDTAQSGMRSANGEPVATGRGSRVPVDSGIVPRLLVPEPPKAGTAVATGKTDTDTHAAMPAAADENAAEARIRPAQGHRADPPVPKEGSGRPGTTPLADALDVMVSLKTLQQHAEGALARIVLDQLASLPQSDGKQLVWQMEIPFTDGRHPDSAKLKIVREGASGDVPSGQPRWSVTLELSPPGLGSIHSRITLWGGRVDTYFWSDLNSTSALIQGNLDRLAARLQQAGLEVGQLNALPGTPPESKAATSPPVKLVDIRT